MCLLRYLCKMKLPSNSSVRLYHVIISLVSVKTEFLIILSERCLPTFQLCHYLLDFEFLSLWSPFRREFSHVLWAMNLLNSSPLWERKYLISSAVSVLSIMRHAYSWHTKRQIWWVRSPCCGWLRWDIEVHCGIYCLYFFRISDQTSRRNWELLSRWWRRKWGTSMKLVVCPISRTSRMRYVGWLPHKAWLNQN